MDEYGYVYLIDFGISKFININDSRPGSLKGTAFFMAPEVLKEEDPSNYLNDWWAVGILLYLILKMIC